MKFYRNEEKNNSIKKMQGRFGKGFEDVVEAILQDNLLLIEENKNQTKYSGQKLLTVQIDNYVRIVPCIYADD